MNKFYLTFLGVVMGGLLARLITTPRFRRLPLFVDERPVLWTHKRLHEKTRETWPAPKDRYLWAG